MQPIPQPVSTILNGPSVQPFSGKAPKQLIIFLHGLGADGNDLIGLTDEFAEDFPDAKFVSPHAPFACDMAPYGRQWFSLQDRAMAAMTHGARIAAPILNDYIDEQLKLANLTIKDCFIIGFSQGTMMALYTMLRRPEPCAGIVGFSGAMIADDANPISCKPPVCLIHGDADAVVPFAALANAQEALKAVGVPCETHSRPNLGHGIDEVGILTAQQFMDGRIKL